MKALDATCTIIVTSCDRYADLHEPFAKLFHKFWPDCPYELVLVTETRAGVSDSMFDRIIKTGLGKCWGQMLNAALEEVSSPWVILMMDDYFLSAEVDTAHIRFRLEEAVRHNAAHLRLMPNPPGRIPFRDTDLMEYPKQHAYAVTTQTGFWRHDYIKRLAGLSKSAWEFEREGSFKLQDETRPLLVTRTQEFPFVDAVHKGYWELFGVELLKDNGIELDFTKRGLPPLSVRLRETVKKLIFAVFPWTFIVRIQNALGVGMKEKHSAQVRA